MSICTLFCVLDLTVQASHMSMFTPCFRPRLVLLSILALPLTGCCGAHPFSPCQLLLDLGFIMKYLPAPSLLLLAFCFHPTWPTISLVWSWAYPSDSTPIGYTRKSCIEDLKSWWNTAQVAHAFLSTLHPFLQPET